MKRCKKFFKILLILGVLSHTITACLANGENNSNMKSQSTSQDQQNIGQTSSKPLLEQLHSIVLKNIQPLTGINDARKSPAIAVGLVTSEGDLSVTLGRRNIWSNQPPDGDTLFAIGSITKLFTGLILAQAVTNGDLDLSERANVWLDKKMHIDDRITLRHLVSHFSGLPNFPGNIMTRKNISNDRKANQLMPAKDYSRENLENCLRNNNCRPNVPPGQKYLYSNFGIGLLSIILQNRYEYSDFNSLNQAKITRILNMQNTSTNIDSFVKQHKNNFAQGYHYAADSGRLMPVAFSDMGVLAGAGELISCVNDMNIFLKMLTRLSHSSLDNAAREVVQELGKTDKPDVITAYAHRVKQIRDGGQIHFKSGLTPGHSAILLWRDNPKVGLIILANRGRFSPLKALSIKLMGRITHQLNK